MTSDARPAEECDFGFDPDEDDGDGLEFDCGMYPDGTCGLAGTEECDWECPYS